jgi:hypothetical protein
MRQRENSASFFILVQIQAGPPAFAAPQLRLGSHLQAKAGQRSQWRQNRSKMPVDWAFKTLSRLRNLV